MRGVIRSVRWTWSVRGVVVIGAYSSRYCGVVPLLPPLADPSARLAVSFGPDALSYRDLSALAAGLAQRLRGRNRVAVWAPPGLATCVGVAGALAAGVAAVPINPKIGTRELAHVVTDAAPDAVLAAPDAVLPAALAALPRVAVDPSAADAAAAPAEPPADAPALIVYTSGTTGPPKGVVLSRSALAANLDALAQAWDWTAEDVLAHALPLTHVHGLVLGVLGVLRRGGQLRYLPRFDAPTVAGAISGGATMIFGVPTHYHRLAGELAADPAAAAAVAQARLLVSGSAALSTVDLRAIESLTGHQVRQRYGMTETLIITAARADLLPSPGRVGRPLQGMDVLIAAEQPGELGEVEVRGPSLFKGYLNSPDATERAYRDGWFRTGDIGLLDADSGELELFGRQGTDLISSGGYRIGAGEIENALLEHPDVAEAAVLGLPDADLGQRVVAWVVRAEGVPHRGTSAAAELVDHVVALLGPHKRPREVRYTAELPRNEMGKVVKARLLEATTLSDTE